MFHIQNREQKLLNRHIDKATSDEGKTEGELGNDEATEPHSSVVNNATVKNEQSNGVSSSETAFSSPRSPLTRLNVNQRSNKFRNQVIMQTQGACESPDESAERQSAVTPTPSNTKQLAENDNEETEENDGNAEDPILSQFSSELSSVGSFTEDESVTNETTKADQSEGGVRSSKKRSLDDRGKNKSTTHSKRSKGCSSKQTTLNAWLVKKS